MQPSVRKVRCGQRSSWAGGLTAGGMAAWEKMVREDLVGVMLEERVMCVEEGDKPHRYPCRGCTWQGVSGIVLTE